MAAPKILLAANIFLVTTVAHLDAFCVIGEALLYKALGAADAFCYQGGGMGMSMR